MMNPIEQVLDLYPENSPEGPGTYLLLAPGVRRVKVGQSTKSIATRVRANSMGADPTHLIAVIEGNTGAEGRLHSYLRPFHSHGEWFYLTRTVAETILLIRLSGADLSSFAPPEKATLAGLVRPGAEFRKPRGRRIFTRMGVSATNVLELNPHIVYGVLGGKVTLFGQKHKVVAKTKDIMTSMDLQDLYANNQDEDEPYDDAIDKVALDLDDDFDLPGKRPKDES